MVNCFTGPNGSGKTNLLDAIYYLAMTKSYFSSTDSHNIRHGAGMFIIQGEFMKDNVTDVVYASVKQGQKKQFKKNQQEYDRLADHIGLFPVVMVAPTDQDLVTESGETRRKFLDIVISQVDRTYLEDLIGYHQVLSHRNALLKDLQRNRGGASEMLEIWDQKLIQFGTGIHSRRSTFIEAFRPHFLKVFEAIAGPGEPVDIQYESKLNSHSFQELLDMSRHRDMDQGYTGQGIHKDDIMIRLRGLPVKKYASQGQQKSVVTSLKLAQFSYLVENGFTRPIVLLDDIFDKLDRNRVSRLLDLVTGDDFGQVFITDTDPDRVISLFNGTGIQLKVFHVEGNTVHAVTEADNG
jgi:DNA replication and repair protein RecF